MSDNYRCIYCEEWIPEEEMVLPEKEICCSCYNELEDRNLRKLNEHNLSYAKSAKNNNLEAKEE